MTRRLRLQQMHLIFAIAVLAVLPSTLRSQADSAGAQVRVWSAELPEPKWKALFGAWTPDSLELDAPPRRWRAVPRVDGKPAWVISRRSVTRLDMLVPRKRREGARIYGLVGVASGALNGLVMGALAGALGAEYYPHGTDRPGISPVLVAVPAGAVVGGALGVLVGAVFPGKVWRTVHRGPGGTDRD